MAFLEEIKMKICVLTLGCKVNHYESEVIKDLFIKRGDLIASIDESPDVVVINTCSVTNQSDSKSRKIIRQAKRKNKESIIVVCGCSSEHHKEELFDLGIDILIGNKDKTKIPDLVDNYLKDNNKYSKFYNLLESDFEDMEINNFEGKTRAFVKIQDGCNNYCSYCIIPYVRGKLRNKDLDVAIKEIKSLVERGFKEVVLTGIHTGSYGRGTDYNIVTLIKEISKLKDLLRIRISSIEITEIDDEFLNELKTNWNNLEQRKQIFEALEEAGISVEQLMEITNNKEADPFDLLCFVAFDLKPLTRKQRADLLKKNKPDLFQELSEKAQEILNLIIEKYIEFGPNQLTPEIIAVSPISDKGNSYEIVQEFGGIDQFKNIIEQIQTLLYTDAA